MVRIIKMKARMIRAFTFANETGGRVSSVFMPPDAAAAGGSVTTHGLGCQGWDLQAMSSMASPMRSQTARWSSTTKARGNGVRTSQGRSPRVRPAGSTLDGPQ